MMSDLRETYASGIAEVARAAQRAGALGYMTSGGGNISLRLAEDVIAVTPTSMTKRQIVDADICLIDPDGNVLSALNGRRPTGEVLFHTYLYSQRPDIKGLVHAHPPVMCGFAIARSELLSRPFLPEMVFEAGPVVTLPYAEPLSEALARTFDEPCRTHNAFLMAGHGCLFMGRNGCEQALDILEMVETAAHSILVAQQLGNAEEICREEVIALGRVMDERGMIYPGVPGEVKSIESLYYPES
jgi:L-fuculose-phosphate aldolase